MKIWSTPYSDIGVTGTITVKPRPWVNLAICWNPRASGGTRPLTHPLSMVAMWAVTIRPVRTISRKPQDSAGSSETARQACESALLLTRGEGTVRPSRRREEPDRNDLAARPVRSTEK